jgi:hypothetical protein
MFKLFYELESYPKIPSYCFIEKNDECLHMCYKKVTLQKMHIVKIHFQLLSISRIHVKFQFLQKSLLLK